MGREQEAVAPDEVARIATAYHALASLDPNAQRRALDWLTDRLSHDRRRACEWQWFWDVVNGDARFVVAEAYEEALCSSTSA